MQRLIQHRLVQHRLVQHRLIQHRLVQHRLVQRTLAQHLVLSLLLSASAAAGVSCGGAATLPDGPAHVVAVARSGTVQLTWDPVAGAVSYRVTRASAGQPSATVQLDGNTSSLDLNNPAYVTPCLLNGATYSLSVTWLDKAGKESAAASSNAAALAATGTALGASCAYSAGCDTGLVCELNADPPPGYDNCTAYCWKPCVQDADCPAQCQCNAPHNGNSRLCENKTASAGVLCK